MRAHQSSIRACDYRSPADNGGRGQISISIDYRFFVRLNEYQYEYQFDDIRVTTAILYLRAGDFPTFPR